VVDQTIGRRIVGGHGFGRLQLAENALGKLLSKLDTPLVKGIDVPNPTLNKDLHVGCRVSECVEAYAQTNRQRERERERERERWWA
jgi:hypothetical protein